MSNFSHPNFDIKSYILFFFKVKENINSLLNNNGNYVQGNKKKTIQRQTTRTDYQKPSVNDDPVGGDSPEQ